MCARGSRWGGALPEAPACARPADVWRRPRPGQAWPLGRPGVDVGRRALQGPALCRATARFLRPQSRGAGPHGPATSPAKARAAVTTLPCPLSRRWHFLWRDLRVPSRWQASPRSARGVHCPPHPPTVPPATPAGWPAPKAAGYAGWPAGRCWGHTPRPQPGCLGRSFPTSCPCVQVSGGEGVAGMTTPTPTSCPPWPPQRPDGSQTGSASAPEQDGDREPPDTAGRGTWPGSCPPHAPCVDAPSPRTARPRLRGGLVWNVLCRTPGF